MGLQCVGVQQDSNQVQGKQVTCKTESVGALTTQESTPSIQTRAYFECKKKLPLAFKIKNEQGTLPCFFLLMLSPYINQSLVLNMII